MARAAARIEEKEDTRIVALDLNMGCPAVKIVRNGDGSALTKNLPLAGKIIESVVRAVQLPVTVKTRIGYDAGDDITVAFAHMAQESRRRGRYHSRQNAGAGIQRQSGLGSRGQSKARSFHSDYRQRRCAKFGTGSYAHGADGLRCGDDRPRCHGKPMGVCRPHAKPGRTICHGLPGI